ncbi:MAG: hypothetical protein JXJ20_02815 [Anaerolineae bacterium]|jgi:hypothetical protein|nr:hypothetical protein [Anaerolineae bacterium]
MAEQDEFLNYPDILGAITGGPRLNLDVIQCAMSVGPRQIPAGRSCEIVFLIQNASDIDVDVVVDAVLPKQDASNQKKRFLLKNSRLRVGLRPAEVGFATMPVGTSPLTAPAPGYILGLKLSIKRLARRVQRVREPDGGGVFMVSELPQAAQMQLQALRTFDFSIDTGSKKNYIQAQFDVLPPAVADLKERKPTWVSLWTMRDYMDDYAIAERVWEQASTARQKLKRDTVFMPLLKTTQERFEACSYKLFPPEAIFITKLLTLVLELGIIEPTPDDPRPPWPRWFAQMCRLLLQEPALATQVEPLITRLLYGHLVYDAVLHAFTMVSTVTNETFGTPQETKDYAEDIMHALSGGTEIDFARAYFPMVLAGLIANVRVTMPREQVRDTVFILSKALNNRRQEKNTDNAFIFDLTENLIERALDST